jgi:aspartate-semialdehyde dehydrogenase
MTIIERRTVRCAVVGATGLAGQQFLDALATHPWFQVARLAASARSAGKRYADAIRSDAGQLQWYASSPLDPEIADLEVHDARDLPLDDLDLVFSCVEAGPARELEPLYAKSLPVISTASAFRYEDDVPLLLPGINPEHAPLLRAQQKARGWRGFVAPNPNCTTVGLAMTLGPLHRAFGVSHVHMVSMQAVSGAGRSPGVPALDVIDNIIPYIPKEEEKVARETRKILGTLEGAAIAPADFGISATCTRVGVLEGHTMVVHVALRGEPSEGDIARVWREAGKDFIAAGYPSAPAALISLSDDPFRPQVRLDRDAGDGMTTAVGRLRADDSTPGGWRYLLVSHNTKMGAAKGCLLEAEHLLAEGFITTKN